MLLPPIIESFILLHIGSLIMRKQCGAISEVVLVILSRMCRRTSSEFSIDRMPLFLYLPHRDTVSGKQPHPLQWYQEDDIDEVTWYSRLPRLFGWLSNA
jgi:hypothetical protein